ncbi:MAG: cyclic nucleotide-binding domain-containing protein [Pseudomonadota bacterium]
MSSMQDLEQSIRAHPFATGMDTRHVRILAGCAHAVTFSAGTFLFREGEDADTFYWLTAGKAAMELHAPPRGTIRIDTRAAGDALGWSWIVAPYRWFCDARAVAAVQALAFNGVCLRGQLEEDAELARELYRRFVPLMYRSLHATQLQLLDVYGSH